ncbi:LPXTG cell wall anchor domain-containing protein [Microbacterium sp. VKM Ac-2870]|uniref:LPXTG cell wall anchor domain-containing protein n=1 Tax=Microbacterium sp. VKM Ac-2870 TaxID=2783825 RepID=UPI00188ACB96|nr:LPXTG cell wall anchor domain-containing protein [Microbacterium sp. VKM Ac-2870]MBF4561432.1 LPXTG cell wall anchor domain-containing protein [Microbacterium sp. VKM Ac-2870]
MKHRFTKAVASAAIAAALVFAAPAMAQAYTPTGPDTVTVTVTGNGPVTVPGFQPGVQVTFTLVGEGVGPGNLAAVKFAVTSTSLTKTADSSGVATATVQGLPAGSYTLSATGARVSTDAGGTLPSTGGNSDSLLGIWVGGGALVLAGATVAVAATVRRNRQETKA